MLCNSSIIGHLLQACRFRDIAAPRHGWVPPPAAICLGLAGAGISPSVVTGPCPSGRVSQRFIIRPSPAPAVATPFGIAAVCRSQARPASGFCRLNCRLHNHISRHSLIAPPASDQFYYDFTITCPPAGRSGFVRRFGLPGRFAAAILRRLVCFLFRASTCHSARPPLLPARRTAIIIPGFAYSGFRAIWIWLAWPLPASAGVSDRRSIAVSLCHSDYIIGPGNYRDQSDHYLYLRSSPFRHPLIRFIH